MPANEKTSTKLGTLASDVLRRKKTLNNLTQKELLSLAATALTQVKDKNRNG